MDSSSSQGSRPIRPSNININTRLGSTGDDSFYSSPQRISDLLSSSVNSSPCSFISATSTGENDNNNNIELVSCSFTASSASRIRTSSSSNSYVNSFSNTMPERMSEGRREMAGSVSGSVKSSSNNNNSNWEYSHIRHKQGQEHLLYATQGPGQEQGQGQHRYLQRDESSFEDHLHDLYGPGPDHIQQDQQQQQQQTTSGGDSQGHHHYRHGSLIHDNNNDHPSCPKQDKETTSAPIPPPIWPTSCLFCQSVPLPQTTPTPPAAASVSSSLITPNSPTTISSGQQKDPSSLPSTSLPVVCMCPATTSSSSPSSLSWSSSLPARKYRTVSTTVASLDLASALARDTHPEEASTTISTVTITTTTTSTTTTAAASNAITNTATSVAEKPLTTDDKDDDHPNAAAATACWTSTLSPPMSLNSNSMDIHTTTLTTAPVLLSSVSLPSVVDSAAFSGTSSTSLLASRSQQFPVAPAAATGPFLSSSTTEAGGSSTGTTQPTFQAFLSTTNQGSSSHSSSSALSLSRDTCNLLPGLHSMHQHQLFHHIALQQQQQQQQQQYDNDTDNAIEAAEASSSSAAFHSGQNDIFVDEDSPSPTSSAPCSPSCMRFGSRRNNINNNNQGILSSTPDGSSSSVSSSAFHSPSNSITWVSPSRTQQHHHKSSSPMTTVSQQFASLAEFNRNKGKGIARGFHRSSKEERRRLQQAQQIQPWKATMDGLPREIKIHIFRYLSTFQLVRVSRVSRSWRSIAMDGSLWKVIDTTRFYKIIKDDQLRVLGTAASGFLRYANFRGCVQLSGDSLRAIAEHCPNVERLDLTGCLSVSSKSIADVCMNMPLLLHLDLAGLQSVNNYTLQAMAVYCRSLQVLNLAWCKQISGFGLSNLTRSCQDLRKLNVSGCGGLEDRWMPVMGMNLPRLREICLNGCGSLTDRGLIGLLSGLSVASSRKYRKWRMRKRMATSVRVSSLGHLLVNQSSSCGDDDGVGGDDDDDEEDERDRARRELEEDEEYAMEDDSDRESEVDGDDEDDDGNQAKVTSSSSNAAAATTTSTTGSNGRSSEEGLQARLDYLGLSHCRLLTTEALRAIGHYCNRHLRRLELSGCESFTDEGLIILAQNCTRLRLLDLEDVNLLTDASLRAFGMYLPKLERLSLSYCENVTDQGIIRMLRPAPNPTTLSTANNTVIANNVDSAASLCCKRLVYLELDNCVLITDRLLLEFANVLEERKALAIEKMKEREKKREERRERIRQKKRKSSLNLLRSASTSSAYASSPAVSDYQQQQQQTRSTSFEGVNMYLSSSNNNGEEGSSSMASGSGSGSGSFIASRPVNIPVRLRMNPSLAAEAAGPSNGGSFVSSYTSSPLQPRSVLASTSISDEIVVKKTRPGLRIMVPTRSASTIPTTLTSTSSSSLALWPSALQSRRRRLAAAAAAAAAAASKNGKYIRPRPRRRPVRPTLQIFDCRNITLEGVEAAQLRCPSLAIKSYYSWSNPSTSVPAASTLGFGGSGGFLEEAFEGELEEDEEDDDEDADADDEDGSGVAGRRHGSRRGTGNIGSNAGLHGHGGGGGGGGSSSGSANSSQTSLHHLHVQQQHLQLLQLQRLNRPANLLQRARLGLLGNHGGGHGHDGHRDSQCTIL